MLKTPPESLVKVSNGCFSVSFYPPSGMPEFGLLHTVFRFPYLRWLIGKRPHSRASSELSREPWGSEKMNRVEILVTSSSTKLHGSFYHILIVLTLSSIEVFPTQDFCFKLSRTVSREPWGSEKMTGVKILVTSSATKLHWSLYHIF